jgi:hypothetical protein
VWIALVAFALIGIVTLQLGLLELSTGIGRSLEREAALQRENAALGVENSELASSERVHGGALKLGFSSARTDALRFLTMHPHSDVGHAAAALAASRATGVGPGSEASAQQANGREGSEPEAAGREASSGGTSTATESGEASARERSGGEASPTGSAETPAQGGGEPSGGGREAEGGEHSPSGATGGGAEGTAGGTGASPGG